MPTLLHLALQIAAQCAGSKCGNWPMFYSSLFAANSLQIVYSTIVPCTWLTWQYKTGLTIKQRIAPRLTPLAVNLTAMLRVVSSSDSAWCCLSTDVDSEAPTAHNSFSAGFAVLRQCLGSALLPEERLTHTRRFQCSKILIMTQRVKPRFCNPKACFDKGPATCRLWQFQGPCDDVLFLISVRLEFMGRNQSKGTWRCLKLLSDRELSWLGRHCKSTEVFETFALYDWLYWQPRSLAKMYTLHTAT